MELTTIPMEELAPLLQLQLDKGGEAFLVVTGSSMYPTLRHRKDGVVLVPAEKPFKRGDLILYIRQNGQYVLHRIVSRPKNGDFICSGDNQWLPETVNEDQVKAVVSTYVRGGKKISVDSFSARFFIGIWVALFPVRKPIIRLRRVLGRLRRKCRK